MTRYRMTGKEGIRSNYYIVTIEFENTTFINVVLLFVYDV